ncbi:ribosome biogenesis GTPase Der [Gemmatimonadota bacterium]
MDVPPLVAIVGRPNVGKSTLFNRIIRERRAVVDDMPGVTRDRIYAHADWAGVSFRLVDTGGLVPNSKDPMEVAVLAQARVAMEEAALVLFVTDVETGPTDLDGMVAADLRRSNRPVVLAVNKVDSELRDADIHEFHGMGLGEPHPVSAASGRGTGDLLDAVVEGLGLDEPGAVEGSEESSEESEEAAAEEALTSEEEADSGQPIRIAVLGRPNVGKSSFVNVVCGAERVIVSPSAGTTRDPADIEVAVDGRIITLVDTAGLRRRTRVKENVEYYSALRALQSLDRCDVAVLILDATEGSAQQDARILERILERGKGAVLAVNKWDLVEKETGTAEAYERDLRDTLPFASFVPVVFISAKTGQRVDRALRLAIDAGDARRREVRTSRFNAFMEELLRGNEAITPAMGDLRMLYGLQAGVEPPTFLFFVNDPKKVKPNFKRFLERRIREAFSFEGSPMRLRFRRRT